MVVYEEFFHPFISSNILLCILYFCVAMLTNPFQSVVLPKLYGMFFESLKSKKANLAGKNGSYSGSYNGSNNGNMNFMKHITSMSSQGLVYLIIFVYTFVIIMFTLKNLVEAHLIPKFLTFSRDRIFKQTMDRYSSDFKEIKVGEYITRVLEVTRYMKNILAWTASDIIPEVLAVFTTTISFYFIDKELFSLLVFNIALVGTILYVAGNYVADATAMREKHYFDLSQQISDTFSNLMNIYLNNQETTEQDKTSKLNKTYGKEYANQIYMERILINTCQFTTIAIYGLCFFKLYHHYTKKTLSVSTIITTTLLLGNYIKYMFYSTGYIVNNFFAYWGQLKTSIPFLEDIFQNQSKRNIKNGISSGKIKFEDITFAYNENKHAVFDKFNLIIKPKEKVAIIGPSGSGKTTLTKMLVGIHQPQKGQVLIDDLDIQKVDTNYLRQEVIYVNQKTNLFDISIIDNILYGNPDATKEEVTKIMEKYGLFEVYKELQDGIHSQSGVNGSNLSLGMQKVTILMRAILKKGTIYIFDEPLSGLDTSTRSKVIKLILQEVSNKTLIIITHDDEITPFMNKVININNQKGTSK